MTVPQSIGTTGTYSFSPSAADILLYAYSLCNIRRTELTTEHYVDGGLAANLAMIDMSNRNPMRFAMETISLPLTQGTATYVMPSRTIAVSIVTIGIPSGSGSIERVLGPISAFEYQAMPNKAQQGPPSSFFFSLLKIPTITFWQTPDAGGPYTANCQIFVQMQDVDFTNSQGVNSPYRFLDALVTNIAARLSESYRPEKTQALEAKFERQMALALGRDQESVPLSLMPGLQGYWRTY